MVNVFVERGKRIGGGGQTELSGRSKRKRKGGRAGLWGLNRYRAGGCCGVAQTPPQM